MKPVRKSEFAGAGSITQAVGVLFAVASFALGPVVGLVGVMAGLVLFVVGSRQSLKWVCPECRNPLAAKDVRVCPTCRAGANDVAKPTGTSAEEKAGW